uniref:Uncharacterized protein n=1 Tax=Physcomitrium patens TaxID=3218 RepID=A0A2K1JN31_PHYPA|nr:hypothetical protein PHYPA_017782 [Physcomitrium patens]
MREGSVPHNFSTYIICCKYIASFAASKSTRYLASVVLKATMDYLLLDQSIGTSSNLWMSLEMGRLVSKSLP